MTTEHPRLTSCSWCATPDQPDLLFHPGAQLVHQPPVTPEDLLYEAWAVIANVGHENGGWDAQHPDWLNAAVRWRDRWHAHLARTPRPLG